MGGGDVTTSDEIPSAGEAKVLLPEGRPGLLSGSVEQEKAKQQKCSSEPNVTEEHEARRIAIDVADSILPNEVAMMLPEAQRRDIAQMLDLDPLCTDISKPLTEALVDLLWRPLAGCESKLIGLPESEFRMKVHLFWRCAVGLCAMPLSQLEVMAIRKRQFLGQALDECLSGPNANSRLALIRVNLPLFAMVCSMPGEAKEDKRLRAKQAAAKGVVPLTKTEVQPSEKQSIAEDASKQKVEKDPRTQDVECTPTESDDQNKTLLKEKSAAKHTYDVGYKKWENFDDRAALAEVEKQSSKKKSKTSSEETEIKAPMASILNEQLQGQDDDPIQALDRALKRLENQEQKQAEDSAKLKEDKDTAETDTGQLEASMEKASDLQEGKETAVTNTSQHDAATVNTSEVEVGKETETKTQSGKASEADNELDEEVIIEEVPRAPVLSCSSTAKSQQSLDAQYNKWKDFDVDAELASVDKENHAAQAADLPKEPPRFCAVCQLLAQKRCGHCGGPWYCSRECQQQHWREHKKECKLAAMSKNASAREKVEVASKTCTATKAEDAEPAPVVPTPISESAESTAQALNKDYQKWKELNSDSDELDSLDDDYDDVMDLNALTGPAEEVAKIRKHWRYEEKKNKRQMKKKPQEKPKAETSYITSDPITARPCEYRPDESAATKSMKKSYDKWKKMDADAMLLDLDNEGKTEEGNAMRMTAGKGNAVLQCEDYIKDREEYDLDEEIQQKMGGLKRTVQERLKVAAQSKEEGNQLMRQGHVKESCKAYQRGAAALEICHQSTAIMSDGLADKTKRLLGDLHRNLAAAHLQLEEWQGAYESADLALSLVEEGKDDDKARYRRALAAVRLGRKKEAEKDLHLLRSLRGPEDAFVTKIDALLADSQ